MRAAVYHRFGGPEVVGIETVPTPVPADDEVLVRVRTTTVSIADHRSRARDLPRGFGLLAAPVVGFFRPRRPILGMDLAGVVESVGSKVTRFKPGDEVIAFTGGGFGGHAEFRAIRESEGIALKPANMGVDEAITLVFGGHTAVTYFDEVEIGPGTEVLINGGAGAVGTAAIQVAKTRGATVTAVCSASSSNLVRTLGADRVIDYVSEDFASQGKQYDVIMENVGNAPFSRVEQVLKPGGALLMVVLDLPSMISAGRNSRRSGKRVVVLNPAPSSERLRSLVQLAEAGKFRAVIDQTYDFEDIVEAHRYVDTGKKKGSVVVRVSA